jgi:hypothetical protein
LQTIGSKIGSKAFFDPRWEDNGQRELQKQKN